MFNDHLPTKVSRPPLHADLVLEKARAQLINSPRLLTVRAQHSVALRCEWALSRLRKLSDLSVSDLLALEYLQGLCGS